MSNKLIQTTKTNKVTPEKLVSKGTKSTYNCFSIKGKVARGFKQCILYYYYLSVKRILVFSLLGCFFLVPFNGPNWPPTRVMGICGRYRFNSQRMYISSSEHFYFSWSSFDVSILITSGCCRSDGEATTGSCEVPTSTSPFSANAFSRDDFATFVTQIIKTTAWSQCKRSAYKGEPCSWGNTKAILCNGI